MFNELDILKPQYSTSKRPTSPEKNRPDTDPIYGFIARIYPSKISKELIELVIEELITQNVIFNKKNYSSS